MTTIEQDVKALIDVHNWTVGVEGITKTTNIRIRDDSQVNNLDDPDVAATEIVIVIESSISSIVNESDASKLVEYIGFLTIFSVDQDEMELALSLLNSIFDAENFLKVTFDGISGDATIDDINNRATWQWRKLRSK